MNHSVFFDLDGTLCHPRVPFEDIFIASCAPLLAAGPVSDSLLLQAWNAALEEPGPATSAGCLNRALDACNAPATLGLVERCAHTLNEAWADVQELNSGAAETLTRLLGESCRLGLITNGPSDAQRAVIEALGVERSFQWVIVSGDADIGVRKPDARIFLRALAVSRSGAVGTWYVGDSAYKDVAGAARAGLHTCWLCTPDQVFPTDLATPDARISTLMDLVDVLAL